MARKNQTTRTTQQQIKQQFFGGLYLTQMSQKAQKVYIAKYVGGTKMNNFFEGLAECQRAF